MLPNFALAKEYHFVFKMQDKNQTIEYKTEADSWNEAYRDAAVFCKNFLKKKEKLTEERILDIVDICANPREN